MYIFHKGFGDIITVFPKFEGDASNVYNKIK